MQQENNESGSVEERLGKLKISEDDDENDSSYWSDDEDEMTDSDSDDEQLEVLMEMIQSVKQDNIALLQTLTAAQRQQPQQQQRAGNNSTQGQDASVVDHSQHELVANILASRRRADVPTAGEAEEKKKDL